MATRSPAEAIQPLFPRLSGGPSRMPRAQVAEHQKARLEGAMVAAVARHGFAGTTLRELVGLAGVSKSTFYQHFESKEDCFLATFDQIVAALAGRVGAAYQSEGDLRERLVAALTAFMDLAVEEPAAASLAAVESLTLGAAGVAHRERASAIFEGLVEQSFKHLPGSREASPHVVRAIVAGIRGVSYRHLRRDEAGTLPATVEPLIDWALGYQEADRAAVRAAMSAAEKQTPGASAVDGDAVPGWEEPPDSHASKLALSQRDRIIRAAAHVVVQRGYGGLSIPAISAVAGTSNQTFYEHFSSKRDAFLSAFEMAAAEAFGSAHCAFEAATNGAEAIGAGVRGLADYVAAHPMFARLAFFELPTAGPAALDRADAIMDSFTAFLGSDLLPEGVGAPASRLVREAVGTGIWTVLQYEIARGRSNSVPALAPEITRIAVAPLAGPAR
jgi:AcrR family transcriptional regulator